MEIDDVLVLAEAAGAAIMGIYSKGSAAVDSREKADASPLTEADRRSHRLLMAGLARLTPDIPVISEEGDDPSRHASAPIRWVVDPLDGTKEFIKRTGEFTVNIALVQGTTPVLGVVHAPALGTSWFGDAGGAYRCRGPQRDSIQTRRAPSLTALRIVASRDHAGPQVTSLLARFPGAETLSMGSSLKFCLVAEGRADLYLRDGPTMEWDTAAAHAVLRAAGGDVLTLDGASLPYGKPGLRNPHFIAVGDSSVHWPAVLVG